MKPAMPVWCSWTGLCATALLAGCSTVGLAPVGPDTAAGGTLPSTVSQPTKAAAEALQPGQTRAEDVLRRWGPAFTTQVFDQGHQVWQYYQPHGGMAWQSALPGTGLMDTERGRPATEVLLVFDRTKVLRQVLVRELPDDKASRP